MCAGAGGGGATEPVGQGSVAGNGNHDDLSLSTPITITIAGNYNRDIHSKVILRPAGTGAAEPGGRGGPADRGGGGARRAPGPLGGPQRHRRRRRRRPGRRGAAVRRCGDPARSRATRATCRRAMAACRGCIGYVSLPLPTRCGARRITDIYHGIGSRRQVTATRSRRQTRTAATAFPLFSTPIFSVVA